MGQTSDHRPNRRTSPRARLETDVHLFGACVSTGHAEDISPRGLFVSTEQPLEPGDHLLVRLTLPDTSVALDLQCEVRWVRRRQRIDGEQIFPGAGLGFVRLPRFAREMIETYVYRHAPPAGDRTFSSKIPS
jgi:Tfp pilus assembly protein PilZ